MNCFYLTKIDFKVKNPAPMSLTLSACFFQHPWQQRFENQNMCLAIPAKVVNRKEDKAEVDFGEGVLREVNVALVEAKVGDYVLVHAGYAIQVLDEKEALETLRLWNEILGAEAKTGQQRETSWKNNG
jgi:hydrogenase expression/formation protein HypC